MNDYWAKAATAVFLSGVILSAEVFCESRLHATYNVPGSFIAVGNANIANVNVSAYSLTVSGTASYGTGAGTNHYLQVVKGG